jgi:tripartite-type tricarboxylate transporter receptor subunit TctC
MGFEHVIGHAGERHPSQPIKIIVPTAPGGVADIAGRAFAQKLNEIWKTAVVENRTGAGGAIAAD